MDFRKVFTIGVAILAICALSVPSVFAAPCTVPIAPGEVPAFPGSDECIQDPLLIPKYVIPLVIPPVMNNNGTPDSYDIAVREFAQQILPGGIWNTLNGRADAFPGTTLWSYGPAADATPALAPDPASQFNYPAYTFETVPTAPYGTGDPVSVRWINELVQNPDNCFDAFGNVVGVGADCNFIPHILPIDQTLHWANPVGPIDSHGTDPNPYTGPVPIVTHVHGAHVDPHSDGYPEAWWLPAANDISGYFTSGSFFDDATGINDGTLGWADYVYRQDQPATTLWYHDHSLGMTRSNVYAGPAGFWLVRGGLNDLPVGVLPGPAPIAGQTVLELNVPTDPIRQSIREIPVVIQDRSFQPGGGQLFYQGNRAFFEGLNPTGGTAPTLEIPFAPVSDIAPIWNPEAFFTTMVVNGVTWPSLEVAPALYRIRLLNGCNSRFLNLSLKPVDSVTGQPITLRITQTYTLPNGKVKTKTNVKLTELPFYQIGAEQGFLPQVVQIETGFATPITPGTQITSRSQMVKAPNSQQALLMGLAERADVILDFRSLPNGTVVQMFNTAPDAPFGGFPDIPADPATTGQVMQFVVNATLNGASPTDPAGLNPAVDPWNLVLPAEAPVVGIAGVTRNVSLNEEESIQVCVTVAPDGSITAIDLGGAIFDPLDPANICFAAGGVPFAPKAALLGQVGADPVTGAPVGIPLLWTDTTGASTPTDVTMADGTVRQVSVTENPSVGDIENWDIYNFTVDGHPIHLHLVRFEVISRRLIGAAPVARGVGVQPWETGYKDTVTAFPGEITTVKALFDIAGLYVWHCHIVEHEDNEMMRPYVVSP